MAKKLILVIALLLISVVSIGLTIDALDLGVGEDFEEITTDKSFMLDSPLFTHEYESEQYVKPTEAELDETRAALETAFFKKAFANETLEVWYNPSGCPLRIINLETGYVWATDVLKLPEGATRAFEKTVTSAFEVTYRDFTGTAVTKVARDITVKPKVDATKKTITHNVSFETAKEDSKTEEKVTIAFEFQYIVSLTDNGITVTLPNESIVEENCSLTEISFYRYMGNVDTNLDIKDEEGNVIGRNEITNGYIVLPSGNGGLIRYGETSPITSRYRTGFYGTDLNYSKTDSSQLLSMPLFGMVHGVDKDACLVSIDSGDAFASFNYYPPMTETSNNHISYLSFSLRQTYQLNINSGESITMVPTNHYDSDITFSYDFLSGSDANYVGLAKEYQKELYADGELKKQELKSSTGMHVEAFGREYENGLIMKKYYNMTTVSDLLDIDEALRQAGVSDVLYTLKGFYRGGYSASAPSKIKVDGALGNIGRLDEAELDYYMYYNPVLSMNERLSYPSHVMVNVYRAKSYTMEEELAKYYFYSDVPSILDGVNDVIDRYTSKVSFDGVSNYLYGDYNNEYDREDTLAAYESMLGGASYPMYSPNAYLLKNTSEYLTMDLYHERLKIVTDSVPFTQIVLRGYMDLYSTYLNFSTNADLDTLKCIEYGVYPAYLITKEPSHLLSNTLSDNLYATEYARVSGSMASQYESVKLALDQVVGAEIVDREVLALGFVKVTYSNNKAILVNYTNSAQSYNSTSVASMGYEVINNG